MPFDIHVIRAQEFVRLSGRGTVDFRASRQALESLGAACRRRGVDRALLDVRELRSNLTPKEFSALVDMFREIGFSHGHRLAILHVAEQDRRAKAFSFLSSIRGWMVRDFTDFEKAIEWLSKEDKKALNSETAKGDAVPIKKSKGSAANSFDVTVQSVPQSPIVKRPS